MFTCIADDYVFKQVRVTHSSVADFGILLLLGVSSRKEKGRKREREREYFVAYSNGGKRKKNSEVVYYE